MTPFQMNKSQGSLYLRVVYIFININIIIKEKLLLGI